MFFKFVLMVAVVFAMLKLFGEGSGAVRGALKKEVEDDVSNPELLQDSLDELCLFLNGHDEAYWATGLQRVGRALQSPDGVRSALKELSGFFGGMGSLNDVVLEDSGAAEECGVLLDRVFRDMKLYDESARGRAEWMACEEGGKDDLPPRMRSTFGAENEV